MQYEIINLTFLLFQVTHNKEYINEREEHIRKSIFLERREHITLHNRGYYEGKENYLKGINQFSDMVTIIFYIKVCNID